MDLGSAAGGWVQELMFSSVKLQTSEKEFYNNNMAKLNKTFLTCTMEDTDHVSNNVIHKFDIETGNWMPDKKYLDSGKVNTCAYTTLNLNVLNDHNVNKNLQLGTNAVDFKLNEITSQYFNMQTVLFPPNGRRFMHPGFAGLQRGGPGCSLSVKHLVDNYTSFNFYPQPGKHSSFSPKKLMIKTLHNIYEKIPDLVRTSDYPDLLALKPTGAVGKSDAFFTLHHRSGLEMPSQFANIDSDSFLGVPGNLQQAQGLAGQHNLAHLLIVNQTTHLPLYAGGLDVFHNKSERRAVYINLVENDKAGEQLECLDAHSLLPDIEEDEDAVCPRKEHPEPLLHLTPAVNLLGSRNIRIRNYTLTFKEILPGAHWWC